MPLQGTLDRIDRRSNLRRSLAKLRQRLQAARLKEQPREDLFRQWQARWANTKTHLIRRLDVIDQQLSRLAGDTRTSPRLTIVRNDVPSP